MLCGKLKISSLVGVLYSLIIVNSCSIEYAMFISHGVWLLRTRELRRRAKAFGMTFDEFPEAKEWQAGGWKLNMGGQWRVLLARTGLIPASSANQRGDCQTHDVAEIRPGVMV